MRTHAQLLGRTIWQHLSIALFLLLSMEAGLNTTTAQAQTRAYVTNGVSNTISVIDTASNIVVATIPVGVFPFGVAITPDGTRAYVANDNTISVIDTASNTVVATFAPGSDVFEVAITRRMEPEPT
jgi:YVTN family beta-propeller protein